MFLLFTNISGVQLHISRHETTKVRIFFETSLINIAPLGL